MALTKQNTKAPWRAVIENRRARNVYPATAYQKLECGHLMIFTGEKALDARYVKKRRCKQCLLLALD